MEFRDLKKQYQMIKGDVDRQIEEVIESSHFIGGEKIKELESKLAEYVGVKHCITCGSGTDALELALMAWDLGKGDAVFVPDFTFFSSGEVVSMRGATPVFVDVIENTFDMDPVKLEEAVKATISEGRLTPKVVVPVDLFGLPADFPAIRKIADKYGLKILEDAAQGFGGEINGRRACSFGDIGATSFFPAKPLGCYGDGGAIFTDDDDAAAMIRSYCVHGKGDNKYDNVRIGMNSRLDHIQAGILLAKFKAFEGHEVDDVNRVAAKYTEALNGVVKTPFIPDGFTSSWAQYTVRLEEDADRAAIQAEMKEHGIPTMVYYPKPMHVQQAFADDVNGESFPVTEKLCATVLSLPMHPYMTDELIGEVVEALKKVLGR